MNAGATVLLAIALVASRSSDANVDTAALEARVKKLEDTNAKYAEALEFLEKIHQQQTQHAAAAERRDPAPDAMFAVDIASNVATGLVEGPASGAPVTIIEAWDFASPYCERISAMLEQLVDDYAGRLRVVFKNNVVHDQAMGAHLAGCAAGKQGKFQPFKAAFWQDGFLPRKMDDATLVAIAKRVGLDLGRFNSDRASDACKELIERDAAELAKFHANTNPPTFFINGSFVGSALSDDGFRQAIEAQLKVAAGRTDYYEKVVMMTGEKQFRSKVDPKP